MTQEGVFSEVALILPTLNSIDDIENHLDVLAPLLPSFGQIIAVDGFSDDRTFEVLRERLPSNAFAYQRERGLYQSWNDAIAKAERPYCYISTVGDTPDLEALADFFDRALASNVDLALSPPRKIDHATHLPTGSQFILSHIIETFGFERYTVLEPPKVQLLQLLSAFISHKHTMSGSFASNLCKTKFMQEHPFPVGYSGFGDVSWIAKSSMSATIGIYPKSVSDFLVHPRRYRSLDDAQFEALSADILSAIPESKPVYIVARSIVEDRMRLQQMSEKIKRMGGVKKLSSRYWLYKLKKISVSLRYHLARRRIYEAVRNVVVPEKPC